MLILAASGFDLAGVLTAVVAMAILGGALGWVLAIAAKRFHVAADPRVEQILGALPGVN